MAKGCLLPRGPIYNTPITPAQTSQDPAWLGALRGGVTRRQTCYPPAQRGDQFLE